MNLRFIERDGKKILQQLVAIVDSGPGYGSSHTEWQDVPLVEELKRPRDFWIDRTTRWYTSEEVGSAEAFIKVREVLEHEK